MDIQVSKVTMPDQLTKAEIKEAFKDGLKEWLNERAAMFGWISLASIVSAMLGVLAWFIIQSLGWHR